jgi:ADP-ribosyl-[dinitrogen reductase] hydrolase
MINKNNNMLLRIAQGDAYAICVEYVERENNAELFEKALKFESYLQHPKYNKLSAGMFTDDTQQSIAITLSLINNGLNTTADGFLQAFLLCFKRDERDGYSRKFQAILEQSSSVDELKELLITDSTSNGAAMRSVPLGVIKDPQDIIRIGKLQAATTHNTFNAKDSSVLVGLMSHYALYTNEPFKYINEWLTDYNYFDFKTPWRGPVHLKKNDPKSLGVGINTVHAVNTLLIEENSLMGMMKKLINWGGDTDSVAAIAWGIGSARYQDEQLPEFMERDLEIGKQYGPEYLKKLGKQLMEINI